MPEVLRTVLLLASVAPTLSSKSAPTPVNEPLFSEEATFESRAEIGAPVIEITGIVRDVFRDEYNSHCHFLIIESEGKTTYAVSRKLKADRGRLIGATIRIRGECDYTLPPNRRCLGSTVYIYDSKDIAIIKPAPQNPFDVADISIPDNKHMNPEAIVNQGVRRIHGYVLARWQGRSFLIERPGFHEVSRVDVSDQPLPEIGSSVDAVGYAETDLCCVNLSRARWRARGENPHPSPEALDISGRDLHWFWGQPAINRDFHGKTVRLTGSVLSGVENGRFQMDCAGYTVIIDTSSLPEIFPSVEIGSHVQVSGICVTDIDNWRPNEPFPRARGLFVAIRMPQDLVVLKRSPWWTAKRLGVVICILLIALVLFFFWSMSLKRLAERRGRELFRHQIVQAQAEFKVEERTRLAVELHDSLAQNLSGVAMEIEVAQQLSENAPTESARHLGIAARALASSRNELRNCLWDLRCNALEEDNLATAVTRTMTPHCKGVRLHVRFDIRRSRLSDNTTHALLRLIRELALNGIRHGKATDVYIVGTIDGKWLRFAVRDNGCGFNTAKAPGVSEGHFGIQGVRERLAALGGDLTIESKINCGTKATGRIPAPTVDKNGDHDHA